MRFLSYLVTLLFASLIAACGGGGGSPGTITGPQALAVIAPANLTQLVGTAQSFAVVGGKAPYQALSNNELVAIAGVTDGTLTIGTVGVGTATITVRDAFGATVSVPLTSAVAQPLSTTAGAAITVETGKTLTFRVIGGAPGYTATSANTGIASAFVVSDTLSITGIKPGSTTVVVRDGVGTTVNIAVTVTTLGNVALFTTAPSAVTVPINTSQTFAVGGGLGPYTISNSNPAVATVTLSGNSLVIQGLKNGSTSVVIRDSLNTVLPAIAVTVPAPDALFSSAVSPVTIGIGSHAEFVVGGGLGTRIVSSSNSAVAVGTFLDAATTSLRIDALSGGSAVIQIRDNFGTPPLLITVNVPIPTPVAFFTDAPPAITLPNAGSATFHLSGGTTPYSSTSNNTAVATVSQPTTPSSTTYKITAVSAGDATITLTDGTGQILTVDVHVNAGAGAVALFTTAPSSVTVEINTTQTFTVGGGAGTYVVTNSNPSVASTVVTGSGPAGGTLAIHGLLLGSTTITLFDGAGASKVIAVTVKEPATTLAILPASLTISEGSSPVTYNISGGTSPYSVFSSNLTLVTPSAVTGSTFTVPTVCVPSGGATITLTVVDNVGAVATSSLTVNDLDGAATCPP